MNVKKAQSFVTQNAIYIVLVLLIMGIIIYDPNFMSINTLRDVLIQSSTRVIIALGVAFILITAGTDLSAGRVVGFTAVISASMLQIPDYSRRFSRSSASGSMAPNPNCYRCWSSLWTYKWYCRFQASCSAIYRYLGYNANRVRAELPVL